MVDKSTRAWEIDPSTAEVNWFYAQTSDLFEVLDCYTQEPYSKQFFAHCPTTGTWVWFGDLPREVAQKLFIKKYLVDKLAEILKWDGGDPEDFTVKDDDPLDELLDDLRLMFSAFRAKPKFSPAEWE